MEKFKVGDRVKAIRIIDGNAEVVNQIGIVISNNNARSFCVEFDKDIDGHDYHNNGKNGHCWWCMESDLKLVSESKHITIDVYRNKTVAKLYEGDKVIKTGVAKCSPKDEFDFEKGAVIAYSRLMGLEHNAVEETTSFKKGDRVRITANTSNHNFEIGSVVTIVDNSTYSADSWKCEGMDFDNKVDWWWVKKSDMEPVNLDWDKFKAGKIAVKVTEDNFENFVAEAKKHKLTFKSDENFNPFNDSYHLFYCIMRSDIKENEIYIVYEDGTLKCSHHCESEEFIWE